MDRMKAIDKAGRPHNRSGIPFGVAVLLPLCVALVAYGQDGGGGGPAFEAVKPKWRLGQTWFVLSTLELFEFGKLPPGVPKRQDRPRNVDQFRVVGTTTLAGARCYVVSMSHVVIDNLVRNSEDHDFSLLLYYRVSDLHLLRFENYYQDLSPLYFRDYPRRAHTTEMAGYVPLDWPPFTKLDPATGKPPSSEDTSPGSYETAQEVKLEVKGNKVVLAKVRLWMGPSDDPSSDTVQVWEPGKPWWTSATQSWNGRLQCTCRLISWAELADFIREGKTWEPKPPPTPN
jgi:hypothetical protein